MGIEDYDYAPPVYERPLTYTSDARLRDGKGGFYYVFDEGGLKCSEDASQYGDVCLVAPNDMNIVAPHSPGFVYLDCGAWVDNADGNHTRRRDFGLVCGPHVYLCEFLGNRQGHLPDCSVPSVRKLFNELAANGCRVGVQEYVNAGKANEITLNSATRMDPNLYLVVPDFHMPPATWFYSHNEISASSARYDPPDWMASMPIYQKHLHAGDYYYQNLYSFSQQSRDYDRHWDRVKAGPSMGDDIFKTAGQDLVTFLTALTRLTDEVKERLHFIQLGDMFELWLGRDYQYDAGKVNPSWDNEASVNLVSDWALEVMIQNTEVFEALQKLERAGIAEVKYLWGNHDAYVKDTAVTQNLRIKSRDPIYTGLNGDLFIEHGHRFDRSNYDNVSGATSGYHMANLAYAMPVIRKAEPIGRGIGRLSHPTEVDGYLLGASLIYLSKKNAKQKPFSIYLMGHTHAHKLFLFSIHTEYHLYAVPPTGERWQVK